MRAALTAQQPLQGAGFRILTESVASPTLAGAAAGAAGPVPVGAVAPVGSRRAAQNARAGARSSHSANTSRRSPPFDRADVILALDADFLGVGPGSLRYARDVRRRGAGPSTADRMNRLYALESMPTATGARADHRCRSRRARSSRSRGRSPRPSACWRQPRRRRAAVRPLRHSCAPTGRRGGQGSAGAPGREPRHCRRRPAAGGPRAGARDERGARQRRADASSTPIRSKPRRSISCSRCASSYADMNAGQVDVLLVVGGNPVYTAPADLDVRAALDKVPTRVHLSLHDDETSRAVPLADPGGALSRGLERRARLRRHGVDRAAADRAALRRPVGARAARGAERRRRRRPATTSVREHWIARDKAAQPASSSSPKGSAAQHSRGCG